MSNVETVFCGSFTFSRSASSRRNYCILKRCRFARVQLFGPVTCRLRRRDWIHFSFFSLRLPFEVNTSFYLARTKVRKYYFKSANFSRTGFTARSTASVSFIRRLLDFRMASALVTGGHAPVGESSGRPGAVKLRFVPTATICFTPRRTGSGRGWSTSAETVSIRWMPTITAFTDTSSSTLRQRRRRLFRTSEPTRHFHGPLMCVAPSARITRRCSSRLQHLRGCHFSSSVFRVHTNGKMKAELFDSAASGVFASYLVAVLAGG